ncbi:MAG: hypothetical protein Hyperionvirus22_10 [Hyperionvirus sp.]|uniref:Uncharacterized protein n=1 Tax=Hyperionvirus sp. TaxID=2487770 RepID=A0A3G5AFZ8_9VIRU|nr:MAG: hypothetical protein Hyperionvirus22_10 [Hyperionvirus sp.]
MFGVVMMKMEVEVTIEDFLKEGYMGGDIVGDARRLFERLKESGEQLRRGDVERYVKKVRGGYGELFELVSLLTKEHNLTKTQFLTLWDDLCDVNEKYDEAKFEVVWIRNLVDRGFFDTMGIDFMIKVMPKEVIRVVMRRGVGSVDDFRLVCKVGCVDDIKKYYEKFKIKPDDACLCEVLGNNGLRYQNLELIAIVYEEIYEYFLGKGLECCVRGEVLEAARGDFDFLGLMLKNGLRISGDDLKIIYGVGGLGDVVRATRIALGSGVRLELELLSVMMSCGRRKKREKDLLGELYDIFFVEVGMVPTVGFCDRVYGADQLYQYLVDRKLFLYSEVGLEKACETGNVDRVRELIGMKYQMNKKYLYLLVGVNGWKFRQNFEIFDFLVSEGGLKVDYEIVGRLFEEEIMIDHLEKYGLKYDDNVYWLYYVNKVGLVRMKKNSCYYKYYAGMMRDSYMKKVIEFRNKFGDWLQVDGVKELMVKYELVPDQYCYEMALVAGSDESVVWMEREFGFKPTILVLKNYNTLMRRYFGENKNKHHASNGDWEKLFLKKIDD